ncbi:hypothetical protein, variant [Spizellomyces punctatus DAOM BR117]|uniref:Uncharacterized protein n=1 Tax=Spizellomyces punctatus (strain DAOM BR117) TaxID=645134 RepID=A0A0L0H5Z4_SPIPD|nr:hypothetical protein, variant [Spizellomyces punctatus DAOM BR117]KNC96935.1 hypothetical protein, variant [Spizellomyces punctatus DAOM BR117]|eukprot:XP_016604975.1 hypothetical protein, variant [Spizellomyces punctatus DAOM BR117]
MPLPSEDVLCLKPRQLVPVVPAPITSPKPVDCTLSCLQTAISDVRDQSSRRREQGREVDESNAAVCGDAMGQVFFERCLIWSGARCLNVLAGVSGSSRNQFAVQCAGVISSVPVVSSLPQAPSNSAPSPPVLSTPSNPVRDPTMTPTVLPSPSTTPSSLSISPILPSLSTLPSLTVISSATSASVSTTAVIATSTATPASTVVAGDSSQSSGPNVIAVTIAGVTTGLLLVGLVILGVFMHRRSHRRRILLLGEGAHSLIAKHPPVPEKDHHIPMEERNLELAVISNYNPEGPRNSAQDIKTPRPEKALSASSSRFSWWNGRFSDTNSWRKSNFIASYARSNSSNGQDEQTKTEEQRRRKVSTSEESGTPITKTWESRHWAEISVDISDTVAVWGILQDDWAFGMIGSPSDTAAPLACGFLPLTSLGSTPANAPVLGFTRQAALSAPTRLTSLGGGPDTYLIPKRDFCLRALASGLLTGAERQIWATELDAIVIKIDGLVGAGAGPFRGKHVEGKGKQEGKLRRLVKGIRSSGDSSDSTVSIPKDQW